MTLSKTTAPPQKIESGFERADRISGPPILLVDDQPARLLTYEAILNGVGVTCVRAQSGAEALQRLLTDAFALILMDVSMPEMDGFETARLIREHPRFERTPIIFVTGVHISELDRLKGYEVGAIDYISVPIVPEILRSKVAVLVELYQRRADLQQVNRELQQARAEIDARHAQALQTLSDFAKVRDDSRLINQFGTLRRLTRSLASATSLEQIAELVIDQVRPALQAEIGVIAVLSDDSSALRNIGFKGVTQETVDAWAEYSLETQVPMAEAARSRAPVVIETREERNRRYPLLADTHGVSHGGSVVCFPLLAREELLGAVGYCFPADRTFDAEDLSFLQALADQCALALERARWFERAQTELEGRRAAERRLESVLESIDDHLVSYDRQWRYVFVNSKAAQVLGKRPEELLGRSIWDVFPEAVDNQYFKDVHRAAAQQKIIRSEFYYAPFDAWFENRIYPSADGVTVFSTDITWRKEAEKAALEADKRKDEFLAILGHELRNPLAAISAAAHLLSKKSANAETAATARDALQRQVSHMGRLLDDLLDVARITRGHLQLRTEAVDVAQLTRSVTETLRPQLSAKGHVLIFDSENDPIFVEGDRVRLNQVLGNILGNAIKYTPPGGRIEMQAGLEGNTVAIRVRDNGIGMPPELLPRVFDMFVQGSNGAAPGLGIGLALAKVLVELHGGRIEAASEGQNQGSLFVISLPALVSRTTETPAADRPAVHSPSVASLRILVADDNSDNAISLGILLGEQGHSVRTVFDGAAALDEAERFRPQVALLDIGMPHVDGYEVAKTIRATEWGKSVLLIAMTGWGQARDKEQATLAGFDSHLTKPTSFEAIETIITQFAERTKERRLSLQ